MPGARRRHGPGRGRGGEQRLHGGRGALEHPHGLGEVDGTAGRDLLVVPQRPWDQVDRPPDGEHDEDQSGQVHATRVGARRRLAPQPGRCVAARLL